MQRQVLLLDVFEVAEQATHLQSLLFDFLFHVRYHAHVESGRGLAALVSVQQRRLGRLILHGLLHELIKLVHPLVIFFLKDFIPLSQSGALSDAKRQLRLQRFDQILHLLQIFLFSGLKQLLIDCVILFL